MSGLAQPDPKQPIILAYSPPPHFQSEIAESSNDHIISHNHPSEQQPHVSVGAGEDTPPLFPPDQAKFAESSNSHIISHDHPSEQQPHISVGVGEDNPSLFPLDQVDFAKASNGDISSHDRHLNKDGASLYQFLLTHSSEIPTYIVSISGTHKEDRTRTVKGDKQGKVEHYTVTITDFEFSINLADYIVVEPPTQVSHGDGEACYRGQRFRRNVQTPTGPRNAKKREIKAFKADKYARINKGVPPWLKFDGSHRYINQPASSVSLRQWVDKYVASKKRFKEFVYEKRVFGWNQEKLQEAIETVVKETGYKGSIDISFDLSANKIRIRSCRVLSWILSLSTWLSKYFPRGRWETTAGMFALFQNEPVEPGGLKEGIATGGASLTAAAMLLESEEGLAEPKGFREGEWFKEWEGKIKSCVEEKIRQSEPMRQPRYNAVSRLDGYHDA